MTHDTTGTPLRQAARARAEDCRRRTLLALHQLQLTGGRITITALARKAGVSPSYLHTQRDVITELAQLRQRPTDADTKRSTSNASHAALLRRLDLTSRRARELAAQNRDLRAELAMAYGQLRNAERRLRDLDTQDRH